MKKKTKFLSNVAEIRLTSAQWKVGAKVWPPLQSPIPSSSPLHSSVCFDFLIDDFKFHVIFWVFSRLCAQRSSRYVLLFAGRAAHFLFRRPFPQCAGQRTPSFAGKRKPIRARIRRGFELLRFGADHRRRCGRATEIPTQSGNAHWRFEAKFDSTKEFPCKCPDQMW